MAEEEQNSRIIPQVIEDEMKRAYLDYAMSVIVGRALPDFRDGLKPVHRRILYMMHEMGLKSTSKFRKCATIVGYTMGQYHPHGDTAIYDALVRMAQPFSLRYPLIRGQGNFGSQDGDKQAAMRYTEAKLEKISDEILQDLEKETVEMVENFDGSLKEPLVMPSKIPNLLINGSSGIAVGMATNVPPHNLNEICKAVIALIDNPEITFEELINIVSGPDFPTGGIISGRSGIVNAYKTGRGKLTVKSVINEEEKAGKKKLIVSEIPYQIIKAQLIEEIADCVRNKKIEGISDLRDESDKDGMRIVIELKNNANPEIVKNQLLKFSRLQTTYSIIMLGLIDNQPKILPLKENLSIFLQHRQIVVRKRIQYDLRKAQEKAHILEGLIVALDNIDPIIALIKKAKSAAIAKEQLVSKYELSELQSQAILEMRLQKLTGLEQDKIRSDHKELMDKIKEYKEILADEFKILNVIKEELTEIIEKYGDERRTEITENGEADIEIEDLVVPEDQIITLSHQGYIKRMPINVYKTQARGGKGVITGTTNDKDFLEKIFISNTRSYLLCFTESGKVHWLKAYQIPEAGRYSKGKAIVNLIANNNGERVTSVIPISKFEDGNYMVFATKNGLIKKTELMQFSKPRQGGIKAITLNEGDELIQVLLTDGKHDLLIASKNGNAVRFNEERVRAMGRTASGVRGIKLEDDHVVGMIHANDGDKILTITENGFGKKSNIEDYRITNRGGKGVINIQCTERNGKVVYVQSVKDEDELIFMSKNGIAIRMLSKSISTIGRNTQGMRLMRILPGDEVVSCTKIEAEEPDEKVQE